MDILLSNTSTPTSLVVANKVHTQTQNRYPPREMPTCICTRWLRWGHFGSHPEYDAIMERQTLWRKLSESESDWWILRRKEADNTSMMITVPTGQYVVDDGERKREIMRMSSAGNCAWCRLADFAGALSRGWCQTGYSRDTVPHFLRRNSKAVAACCLQIASEISL
jgi:hypothetical protein